MESIELFIDVFPIDLDLFRLVIFYGFEGHGIHHHFSPPFKGNSNLSFLLNMGEAIQVAIQTGKANFPTNSGFVRLFPRTTLPGDPIAGFKRQIEPFETKKPPWEQSFFSWFHDMHLEPIFGFSKSYISS